MEATRAVRASDADRWLPFAAPGLAATAYPFLLDQFHASLGTSAQVGLFALGWLSLALAVPLIAIWTADTLGRVPRPDVGQLRARRLAILTTAAPTVYVFMGVLTYMAGSRVSDTVLWLIVWLSVTAFSLLGLNHREPIALARDVTTSPKLRIAHGASAAFIVLIFLAIHLSNHLSALWSLAEQKHLMESFRRIYRAAFVEPVLVALFLFQIGSGLYLVLKHSTQTSDFFRNLQLCSGAYLLFFVLGHMNSVFIYARSVMKIPTDWNFAIGAPTGLIADAWNIRLLPHYLLGVTFVLTHLILGARIVALNHQHGERRRIVSINRFTLGAIAIALCLATAIVLGMVGIHVKTLLNN